MRSLVHKSRSRSGGVASVLAWPPQLALRTHQGCMITGTDADVLSCEVAPGYVWQKVDYGTGSPITRSDSASDGGFEFTGGCYFQMTLPQPVTLRALSIHGAVTLAGLPTTHPDYDTARTPVHSVFGVHTDGIATISTSRQKRDLRTDLGPTDFSVRDLHTLGVMGDIRYQSRVILGVHSSTLPEYQEYASGGTAIWANGMVRIASDEQNELTTDTFIMGKDFWGTVHEGVVFSEGAHSPLPLWEPGTNVQAIHKALTERWGTSLPALIT